MFGFFADRAGPDIEVVAADVVAVQPVGAVEHHGPHLPLITDSLIAGEVAAAIVDAHPEQPVAVLPTLSYGLSSEHLWAPGTVSLGPETMLRVLDDVGASLARAGVRRLLFLNGHGGNSALLRVACREVRVRHGLLTFLAHPQMPADQGGAGGEEGFAIHGGADETSLVLHLRPGLVDLRRAEPSLPRYLGEYRHLGFGAEVTFGWTSQDVMPSGVIGDPTQASAERGRELFEGCVARFGPILDEIRRFSFPAPGDDRPPPHVR